MNRKEVVLIIIAGLLMFGLYLTQRERLKDYNDCYMMKYTRWDYPCELGGRR